MKRKETCPVSARMWVLPLPQISSTAHTCTCTYFLACYTTAHISWSLLNVDVQYVLCNVHVYRYVYVYVNLTHITTERGVWLCTGHTGWKELHGPALGVAETTQHEASIFLLSDHHVTVLAHRAHTDTLTQYKVLLEWKNSNTCIHSTHAHDSKKHATEHKIFYSLHEGSVV